MYSNPIIPYLEKRFYGEYVNIETLIEKAMSDAEFTGSWLIHAVASHCSIRELAVVIALAQLHKLIELKELISIWRDIDVGLDVENISEVSNQFIEHLRDVKFTVLYDPDVLMVWRKLSLIINENQAVECVKAKKLSIELPKILTERAVEKGRRQLELVQVYGADTKANVKENIRNNTQYATRSPCSDVVYGSLERIIAGKLGLTLANAEPLMLYRYTVGQEYKWHCDYLPSITEQSKREIEKFGQRSVTAILYLSSDFSGGETAFKVWQQKFKCKMGDLIFFNSLDKSNREDSSSVHAGLPVKNGEKWISTLWFRTVPLWTRVGLLE